MGRALTLAGRNREDSFTKATLASKSNIKFDVHTMMLIHANAAPRKEEAGKKLDLSWHWNFVCRGRVLGAPSFHGPSLPPSYFATSDASSHPNL
jgi:hypothetical protein